MATAGRALLRWRDIRLFEPTTVRPTRSVEKGGLSISDGCHSQPFSNKSGWLCEGAAGRGCVIL